MRIDSRLLSNEGFRKWLEEIAAKHGCTVRIDWNTHTLWFDGPPENEMALIEALDRYLS